MTALPIPAEVAAWPVTIRPWRAGDEQLLRAAEPSISRESLASRFFVGTPRLPEAYLRHISTVGRDRWDAVVALVDGRVVGWAEYGRSLDDPREAELGVLVVDDWQGGGLGPRLVGALLLRCRRAGVTALRADVQPDNRRAQRAIESRLGRPVAADAEDGVLRYVLPLGVTAVSPQSPGSPAGGAESAAGSCSTASVAS
jgi:GNAT superfamily N-acetyltransferase